MYLSCLLYFQHIFHFATDAVFFVCFFISHGVVGQFRPAGSKSTDHKSQVLLQKLGGTSDAFHYNSEVGFSSFAASFLIAPLGFRILESWRKLELGIQYDRHVYQQCFDKHSNMNLGLTLCSHTLHEALRCKQFIFTCSTLVQTWMRQCLRWPFPHVLSYCERMRRKSCCYLQIAMWQSQKTSVRFKLQNPVAAICVCKKKKKSI